MKLRPTRQSGLVVLLAVLAGCDRIQPDLPTEAPAGNELASGQFRVAPDTLQFLVFKPEHDSDFDASSGAATAGGGGARQAFTGTGVGSAGSMNALGDGAMPEAVGTVKTLVLSNDGATPMVWSAADTVPWLSVSPAGGTVAAGESRTLEVKVDSAVLRTGDEHQTEIVLTAGSGIHRVPVAVTVVAGTVLSNRQTFYLSYEHSGMYLDPYYFVISVPTGADSLDISTRLRGFDWADVYVRRGGLPTRSDFDCTRRTRHGSRFARCAFAPPAPGDYFITVEGYDSELEFWEVRLDVSYRLTPVPTDLTATGAGAQRVNVGWRLDGHNVTELRVYRSTRGPDGTFAPYRMVGTLPGSSTSFTDVPVALDATYRYKVVACNQDICATSAPSAPITVVQPPGPPTLGAQVGFGPRIDLSWSGSGNRASSYQVWRSRRNPDGSYPPYTWLDATSAITYSDVTVDAEQWYTYHVRGCNAFGCTASLPVTVYVPLPPAAPASLRARVYSATRVDLDWTDASTNETSFRVRRSTRGPDGTFLPSQTVGTLPAGSSDYADVGVASGNAYHYQVQACNASGCAISSAVVVSVPSPPAAPSAVRVRAASASRVDVGWTDASTNESSFRVRRTLRRPDGTFAPYQTLAVLSPGVTSYSDPTVAAGETYRYVIQACNTGGCGNSASAGVTVPGS